VNVPRVVVEIVLTSSVELPGAAIGLVDQLAVVRPGNPATLRVTFPLKPPTDDAVIPNEAD
jgi:hypothetical protein